jgi:phosphatidylserine synthase
LTGLTTSVDDQRFTGVPTTFAAGCFLIANACLKYLPLKYFSPVLFLFFGAFALLMISGFTYSKYGPLTKLLYLLLPLSIIVIWL